MEQVIIGGNYDLLRTTNTEYNIVVGEGYAWATTPDAWSFATCIPTAGKLKNLRVELNDVPGTGTYVFTLHRAVGIGAWANTALTCEVAADGTQASDMVNEVAVAAGDVICLECNPDAPDNARYAKWSMVFEGDTANESVLLVSAVAAQAFTMYYRPMGRADSATEASGRCVCPTGGTIKNLYVRLSADPGTDPDAYKFTLRIGGASQTLTCTITANGRVGSDVAHPIAVSAGDILTLMCEPLNAPSVTSVAAVGLTFVADTNGESLILGGSSGLLDDTDTEYNHLISYLDRAWTAIEVERYQLAQECVLKKLYVLLDGIPGIGNTYVFTVRQNTQSPVDGLVVTIPEEGTTGNDTTNTITVADDDELDMEVNPDSTPTVRRAYWGLVCYIEPPIPTFIPTVTII